MKTSTAYLAGASAAVLLAGVGFGVTEALNSPAHRYAAVVNSAASQEHATSNDTVPATPAAYTAADHTVCLLLAGQHYASPADASAPVDQAWGESSQLTDVTKGTVSLLHQTVTVDWPAQKAAGYAVQTYAAEDAVQINAYLDTLTADCTKAGAL